MRHQILSIPHGSKESLVNGTFGVTQSGAKAR
jgi:hypothetical protein